MVDLIVQWLTAADISAADFVLYLSIIGTAIYHFAVKSKGVYKGVHDAVQNEVLSEQAEQKFKDEFEEMKAQLSSIEDSYKSLADSSTTGDVDLKRALEAAERLTNDHTERLAFIENQLASVASKVDMLSGNLSSYCRIYLMDAYNKYVNDKKSIDLITLQNIETVYNKYQAAHENDEFLSRIMTELRDLPTVARGQ